MYIRKSRRTKKGKTYYYYQLVESLHTPKGPRQRVICSLGDLKPKPREFWIDLARRLLRTLSAPEYPAPKSNNQGNDLRP